MKKLNNHGWSIGTMITLICVLFFFILLVGVIAYNFGLEKSSPYSRYDIEDKEEDYR